jgi:lysophospholipase
LTLSDAHSEALENAILPVLLWQAAVRDDSSLKSVLNYLSQYDRTHGGLSETPLSSTSGVINKPSPTLSQTALHLATIQGMASNVALLLSLGASVHVRDMFGHTPIFYALREGNIEIVNILVGAGAHLAQGEKEGEDVAGAWIEAAKREDVDGVRLIEAWKSAGYDGK